MYRLVAILLLFSLTGPAWFRRARRPEVLRVLATAHCQDGISASGAESRRGTVAADPNILPINSWIHISGAGKYSGEYQVIDTGSKVNGRHIDIYMPTAGEAKRFGRKHVRVTVLERGHNERLTADGRPAGGKAAVNVRRQ